MIPLCMEQNPAAYHDLLIETNRIKMNCYCGVFFIDLGHIYRGAEKPRNKPENLEILMTLFRLAIQFHNLEHPPRNFKNNTDRPDNNLKAFETILRLGLIDHV